MKALWQIYLENVDCSVQFVMVASCYFEVYRKVIAVVHCLRKSLC